MVPEPPRLAERRERLRDAMAGASVAALVVSAGADLYYLTGYEAMPLERQTLLALPADRSAHPLLLVPELEAARVSGITTESGVDVVAWGETENPLAMAADHVRTHLSAGSRLAVSDQMWASAVLGLRELLPAEIEFVTAGAVIGAVRAVKDAWELARLDAAAGAADQIASELTDLVEAGMTEAEVAGEIGSRLIESGFDSVGFVIVASGPNAASPHHTPGRRAIERGDWVVCDFGGPMSGYCADITRTVYMGKPSGQDSELYAVLEAAEEAAFSAVRPGVAAEDVDAAARSVITGAGYGEYFIHRTGHGIGLDVHEDPYIVAGNATPLSAGMTFSIEPGIYIPDRCGARLENIVVCTEDGARRLNLAPRALQIAA